MNISTGILAGGKSTRMGKNKALLTINEQRFIDKIAGELGSFSEVLISAAEKACMRIRGFAWYMMSIRTSDRLKGFIRF